MPRYDTINLWVNWLVAIYLLEWNLEGLCENIQGMPKNCHYFLHRKWEQNKKLQSKNSVPRHEYSFGKMALVYWEWRGWFVEIVIGNTIFTTMVNWFRKKLLIRRDYGEWLLRHGYSFSSSFFLMMIPLIHYSIENNIVIEFGWVTGVVI